VLPDFLRSNGSGMGSTQPLEYNWGAARKKKYRLRSKNLQYGRVDPLRWSRDTLYPQKLVLNSPTCGGRSVGIARRLRPRSILWPERIKLQKVKNKKCKVTPVLN
jgi:hypothetical protein